MGLALRWSYRIAAQPQTPLYPFPPALISVVLLGAWQFLPGEGEGVPTPTGFPAHCISVATAGPGRWLQGEGGRDSGRGCGRMSERKYTPQLVPQLSPSLLPALLPALIALLRIVSISRAFIHNLYLLVEQCLW